MGQYNLVCLSDSLYIVDLFGTHKSIHKEGSPEMPGTVHNRISGLSIINGVLLYKHLIHPMTDYVCPIWRSAVYTNGRKLYVVQSNCLHIATNTI